MLRNLPLLVLVLSAVLVSCVDGQTKIMKQRFKKCPRNCKCFRATGTKGLDVDCSDKGLTDLPLLPRNTITL